MPAGQRTVSPRKAAGGKRNRRLRYVGSHESDLRQDSRARNYAHDPTWRNKPNHKSRAINIEVLTNYVRGITQHAAANHPDQTAKHRIRLVDTRLIKAKINEALNRG